uniref:PAZ domain-containing protein n=1 Tax=Panagrolaimus davidi TaxID=227884 RepID=A0A914QNF2_9BILA
MKNRNIQVKGIDISCSWEAYVYNHELNITVQQYLWIVHGIVLNFPSLPLIIGTNNNGELKYYPMELLDIQASEIYKYYPIELLDINSSEFITLEINNSKTFVYTTLPKSNVWGGRLRYR